MTTANTRKKEHLPYSFKLFKVQTIHFKFFDNILIVDNSKQSDIYSNILQIEKNKIVLMAEKAPKYFSHRLPEIYNLIKKPKNRLKI